LQLTVRPNPYIQINDARDNRANWSFLGEASCSSFALRPASLPAKSGLLASLG
jgi:hypothetical protein